MEMPVHHRLLPPLASGLRAVPRNRRDARRLLRLIGPNRRGDQPRPCHPRRLDPKPLLRRKMTQVRYTGSGHFRS